jgi:hypothetical protein
MALALWVAGLLGSASAGFGVTGIAFLALGAILVAARLRRGSTRHDGTRCSERRESYERTRNG